MVLPGQSVNISNPLSSRWATGKVTDVLPHRSIEIDLEKGSHVRWNRVDIHESSARCPGSLKRRSARQSRRVKKPSVRLPMSRKSGPRPTVRTRPAVAEL